MRTFLLLTALWLAAEALAGVLTVAVAGAAAPAILAALGNLCVALRFGVTLLPGHEPLITQYSRFDASGVPEGQYTRRLTEAWAGLLGAFALAYALAAVAGWPIAAISATQALVCAGVFLGEHALRNRCFPDHGRATPFRTLRAVLRAEGVAPEAARHVA